MKFFRPYFFIFFVIALSACNEVVILQELDQHDVNEILVVLAKNGIKADRKAVERQQTITWTITVSSGNEQAARELLMANNLPKQKQLGLSGICKVTGLIPTPKMEKCQEMLALKGEIINSLESIPGVVEADAVINIPDKEDFPDANSPILRPSASVVVQIDPALKESPVDEGKVQQFVASAVTGMDVHDVAVIITRGGTTSGGTSGPATALPVIPSFPVSATTEEQNPTEEVGSEADLTKVAGLQMDLQSAKKFKVVFSLVLVFFAGLATALILVLVKMAQMRKTPALPHTMNNPALPEKVTMDRLVEETAGEAKKS